MSFREIVEGDVNYAKMHTQANPKYASGTKWRKSSAAVKAKADDVGAGGGRAWWRVRTRFC